MQKFKLNINHNLDGEGASKQFGISEERSDELIRLMHKHLSEALENDQRSPGEAMDACTQECDSLEEVVYINYILGHMTGHMCERAHHMTGSLGALSNVIMQLAKRGGKNPFSES